MKGVIYARYSSDNQREESIDGQLRECRAFAERNGIDLVGSYIDRAMSAKTDNRPEFQRMIKDSGMKAFDVVLVWKLDRFARDRYDSAFYKRTLRKNGVKVMSITEAISENVVAAILKNRRYIGEYRFRDIVTPNGIPAIVPTDLFERVQERLESNRKAPARHKAEEEYLLSTKLFCGYCKRMMAGDSGKRRDVSGRKRGAKKKNHPIGWFFFLLSIQLPTVTP